jgi:hypothetical protein
MGDRRPRFLRIGARTSAARRRVAYGLVLAVSVGLAAIILPTSSGRATARPAVIPLAKAELPPQLRDQIRSQAKADGVDPDSIVEVGAFGSGRTGRAALVGKGSDGGACVSFFQGFGMTFFQPPGRLFHHGEQVAFSEGFSGPQNQFSRVGVVGAARPSVDRIDVELGDGTIVDAPLVASNGLLFFAYAGDAPSAFPKVVRAYRADGSLLLAHEIPQP